MFLQCDYVYNNRDKGLRWAILHRLAHCCARFCNRHLLGNVKGPSLDGECVRIYWEAVYYPTFDAFNVAMNKLNALRPQAYEYLMNEKTLPRCLWTNYAFPMRHWNSQTNNLAERVINWLGPEMRQKAPTALIKHCLTKTMEQRHERLTQALARQATGVSIYSGK